MILNRIIQSTEMFLDLEIVRKVVMKLFLSLLKHLYPLPHRFLSVITEERIEIFL